MKNQSIIHVESIFDFHTQQWGRDEVFHSLFLFFEKKCVFYGKIYFFFNFKEKIINFSSVYYHSGDNKILIT